MSVETESRVLSIATSPHIREEESVNRIMWRVILALMPIGVASLFLFGWYAGLVILASVASCVFFEAAWQKLAKKPITINDGSAVVTGLLLAYVLPPNVPIFVAVVGAGISIIIAKQIFGGLGYNIWNPALIGRAFVQIAYPQFVSLSVWPILKSISWTGPLQDIRNAAPADQAASGAFDAVSSATPLSYPAVHGISTASAPGAYSLWDMFVGTIPGCIGETSALLILIGGIYLISKGYINWKVPAVFLGSLALFAFIFPSWKVEDAHFFATGGGRGWLFMPVYQVLAGGAMLGAFFMATEMVTTPITSRGQVVFALGCGVITGAIRLLGHGFPEGVCYAILLMNTATPIIDRYTKPARYGLRKAAAK